jgi:molybdate transport system substrate-binding protein
MRKFVLLAAVALIVGLTAGCSSDKKATAGAASKQTITVFAASSLKEVLTGLGSAFEAAHPGTHVVFNFGASSTLAQSLVQGAPADVFASASTKDMGTVVKAGTVTTPVAFATNRITLAVPENNPAHLTALADLNRSGVTFATCEKVAPCGVAATETLKRANITRQPATFAADVKATLNLVQLGEVDGGFVYATDVQSSKGAVISIPLDPSLTVPTHYPAAAVRDSKHADLAGEFVTLLTGPTGQQALKAAGFGSP